MALSHNLGFPRVGRRRELKFALEAYWRGDSSVDQLETEAASIRHINREHQTNCDLIPVGDFSLYDHVLDTSFMLGNVPARAIAGQGSTLDQYFRVARGRSANDQDTACVHAGEMTKWFDTNYHYIVPELTEKTTFTLNPTRLLSEIDEAKRDGKNVKPVLVGPVTYLWLAKSKDNSNRLALLDRILAEYRQLLQLLEQRSIEWVQIDEPILVTELSPEWLGALEKSYHVLQRHSPKILLTTYFGRLRENLQLACRLPVAGLHVDAINGRNEVNHILDWLPAHKVLSLGIINGRNIWKTDLTTTLDWLEPIAEQLGDRLWLAPSCSLLHVPVDLSIEDKLDPEIKAWLAFALQKLEELELLKTAINKGRSAVAEQLQKNKEDLDARKRSKRVHRPDIQERLEKVTPELGSRKNEYAQRSVVQREKLQLPLYPTTTIGSFPQTADIRKARREFKQGQTSEAQYTETMQREITYCIQQQEQLGLDVLVHGEAERNDMVEYFGEQLEGYAFSQFGWVQSYGSRCVKPPILFGDISRPQTMTAKWITFAQSQTSKPVKGMLTGPVTILNWSFVRDDQPRQTTCYQLALAVREEVLDLEKAGVNIIQIDEAALREGLPLRQSEWNEYLEWSVESFRICANGVQDQTQIHTHMCYSEFNDIIEAIARMDADVITIETSRSDMELLDVFKTFAYPNEIGPGVYDIHSPNIPDVDQIVQLMKKASERIPPERLWVNPDCGLKTRQWQEVIPALQNMVEAARALREQPSC